MNIMALFKRPAVLLVVGILLAVVFVSWSSSASLFDDFNTDGKEMEYIGGLTVGVQLNDVEYAASWLSGHDSQPFTASGYFSMDFPALTYVAQYRYALYVDGNSSAILKYPSSTTWIDAAEPGLIKDVYWLQPWNCDGLPIASVTVRIKVALEIQSSTGAEYTALNVIAWDGAYLKSGKCEVYIPANAPQGPFEDGEKVTLYARTGYDTDNTWALKIYPPADRTDLAQTGTTIKTLGNDASTYVYWTVPAGAFKVGSLNDWRAELWNTYFDEGEYIILTIDQHERAPIIESVDEAEGDGGMTYTITTNQTYAEINRIIVYAWYGESTSMPSSTNTEAWIYYNTVFPVVSNSATIVVNCKAQIDGQVVVKFVAYDVEGRPSVPFVASFEDLGDVPNPVPPPLEQPFIWTWLAVLIAGMGALALIAVAFIVPARPSVKVMLIVAIGAGVAILVWMAGTLQLGA